VILFRCFAWAARARETDQDGPLWFPRPFQGDGRHDNPDTFGCLYLADRPESSVVEQLARFRGQPLAASFLKRRGLPLALAELELVGKAALIDLDDPAVLAREHLRPSVVATRARDVTQQQARTLYEHHPDAAGVRWWSTFESQWTNVTLFDRAGPQLRVRNVSRLNLDAPAVITAAEFLGLSRMGSEVQALALGRVFFLSSGARPHPRASCHARRRS